MTIENNRDNKTTKDGGIIIPSSRFCTLDELSRENKCANKISRRDFGKGIAAILASGCAPSVMGGMMRNVGARNAAMFGVGKPTAKDYVQDGLVAMWDGEENNGYGNHISSLLEWKDLKSGIIATANSSVSFGDKFAIFDNTKFFSFVSTLLQSVFVSKILTIEFVINSTDGATNLSTICNHNYEIFPGWFGWNYWASKYAFGALNQSRFTFDNFTSISISSDSVYSNWYVKGNNRLSFKVGTRTDFSNQFYIGKLGSYNSRYRGDLYCLRIYEKCLSQEEVSANYAIDNARFNLA